MKLNLDYLLDRTWEALSLLRIYTKKPGRGPDFSDPIILRGGASVEHVCHSIHRSIVAVFKYALVWVCSSALIMSRRILNVLYVYIWRNILPTCKISMLEVKLHKIACQHRIQTCSERLMPTISSFTLHVILYTCVVITSSSGVYP